MRTSPPRRNTLPSLPPLTPAAEPPDFDDVFREINPLDLGPPPRIPELPDGLMKVLGTQSLQQPDAGNRAGADDDNEIRPRSEPPALPGRQERPQIPAGEASSRPTLPVLPTSPQLIDPILKEIRKKPEYQKSRQERALKRIEESGRYALQDPALQQALRARGIVLHRNELNEQGQPKQRELTPLLEAAANKALAHLAGLSDADMPALDRAVFVAAIIREQLGQVMAVNKEGQPLTAALQVPRRLAEPEDPGSSIAKAAAVAEAGQLQRLAAAYAVEVLRLDTNDATRLRQRATVASVSGLLQFQLKLRDLSRHQGPLAVALVHKLYPPAWVAQQIAAKDAEGNIKAREDASGNHRLALIEALQKLPAGVMDRLRAAAASPDPEAMSKACKEIEDAASELEVGGPDLRHALMRLQGRDYEPAVIGRRALILNNALGRRMPPAPTAYAGAPPADEALRWLRSNGPSSAQPMPER
jgi:hypothetical protein